MTIYQRSESVSVLGPLQIYSRQVYTWYQHQKKFVLIGGSNGGARDTYLLPIHPPPTTGNLNSFHLMHGKTEKFGKIMC